MFTPSSQITQLAWDTAGSKSVVVPVGATAMRLFTHGSLAYALGATASPAGMRVAGSPDLPTTEIIGCTESTTVSFYGGAGATLQITWGVASGGGGTEPGPPGPAGPAGPQGVQGIKGDPGAQGVAGLSVLNGTGAPGGGIGRDGEFYIDTTAHTIYGPKTAGAWGGATPLVGPQGPAGAAGAAGAQGPAGPTGAQGPVGPQGPTGAGIVPDGYGDLTDSFIATTEAGGVDVIYVVNPNGDLRSNPNVPAGLSGDMSRHVIGWSTSNSAWSDYGQFTGMPGPPGATGAQGPMGPQGPAGAAGATGPAGKTVLNGSGAPSNAIGTAGDFYVDTTNSRFYGPKAGTWPGTYVTIIGTQGPQGATGATGAQGPAGATGAQGPAGTPGVGVPSGGTTGQVLAKTSNANYATGWVDAGGGGGGGGYPSLNKYQIIQEDFLRSGALTTATFGQGGLGIQAVGTSAGCTGILMPGNPGRTCEGVAELSTGTTTTGYAYVRCVATTSVNYNLSQCKLSSKTSILVPVLPDPTDNFDWGVGHTSNGANPAGSIGATLRHRNGVNSGKFQIYVNDNATTNTYNTGITPTANTYYDVEFIFDGAADTVTIKINDTTFGPYGWTSNNAYPLTAFTIKNAGTTARTLQVDYVEQIAEWLTLR